VFSSSRSYESPVSDEEKTTFTTPLGSPIRETSKIALYTPDTPRTISSVKYPHLEDQEINTELSNLSISTSQSHVIFRIPEILTKILTFVDEFTSIPTEDSPVRRRPLSYQHAVLIYKDERRAQQVWSDSTQGSFDEEGNPVTVFSGSNSLYNCLFVNSLWSQVSMEVASTKLFFSDMSKWNKFVQKTNRTQLTRRRSNTKLFVMHKLSKAEQSDLEVVAPSISGSLEWIEMYICPKVLPTTSMFSGSSLKKLVLPGSRVADDSFLKLVSKYCPLLETLDLRACGLVTDEGMVHLLSRCNRLTTLNLGRHSQTSKITDLTLAAISKYTSIETLGMAGCSITDRGLWELALRCSDSITRLSLNGCRQLTNDSIPLILARGYLPHLSVLEIRHILGLTNFKPLVMFQRLKYQMGQNVLIEGCEVLEYRMRTEEWRQDMKNYAKMLNEIQRWCDGDDVPYEQAGACTN
jgi:antagonist of mitotic exit network protein 1